jgi:4-amino-4-deoxy-L-arabinose transferase-like glycosyltransferase
MRVASSLLAPIDRLVSALADPAGRERTALGALAVYVVVWTLYAVLAKASQDINYDSAGLVAWSRELALGYPAHPPLGPWLVRAWFALFPLADGSYYLLAMLCAAVALWAAWMACGGFLNAEKRVAALALLTLVPFYNLFILKFDHNALLVPLWALTTWWFIRSFETRGLGWAALAGLGAAAAMLGKYWSIFLLAGLGLAALIHPQRRDYFRSGAPWITVAAGALGLAPHIAWLASHQFSSFAYPIAAHGQKPVTDLAESVLRYFTGAGYVGLPVLLLIVAARPNLAALADSIKPRTPERRFAAVAFWTPLLLPALVAPLVDITLNPIWTMSAVTLLPVVLLSSPLISISRPALRGIVAVALALPLLLTAAAPGIAIIIHRIGGEATAANGRLVTGLVAQEWGKTTGAPLHFVGGDVDLANVMAFYLPERPLVFSPDDPGVVPWIDPARVAHDGIALACHARLPICPGEAAKDPNCYASGPICIHEPVRNRMAALAAQGPPGRRVITEVTRTYHGVVGRPALYIFVTVPPQP